MDPIYASSALELVKGRKLKGRVVRLSQGQKKKDDTIIVVKEGQNRLPMDEEDLVIASAIGKQANAVEANNMRAKGVQNSGDNRTDRDLSSDVVAETGLDGRQAEHFLVESTAEISNGLKNRQRRREEGRMNKSKKRPLNGFGS